MRYPPRSGHLATRAVIVAKLVPTYAAAHNIEDDEAVQRLQRAFAGRLYEDMLSAAWDALLAGKKRLDDDGLVEKVAGSLSERPLRPGRLAKTTPALSAFLLLADLEAGTATESARKVLESDAGKAVLKKGITEVGEFLAAELTRPK